MSRKGENIYKRKDGRWEGRYIKARTPHGKAIYGSIYGKKYTEVKVQLISLKKLYASSQICIKNFSGSMIDWITYWLEEIVKKGIKDSTYTNYRGVIQRHIMPVFKDKFLHELTTEDIQKFVNELQLEGLKANTINGIFNILQSALKQAVFANAIISNPCKNVILPKIEKVKISALTPSEQKSLEVIAMQDNQGIAVMLALYTGMRVGEICALKWADIDFSESLIHVNQTILRIPCYDKSEKKTKIVFGPPKSESSCRTIPISKSLLDYLCRCREDSTGEYVVSCKGSFAEPRVVSYRFHELLKKAEIKSTRFHALRHTFATRCIELNVDIASISKLLGHASIKMTLDIYTDSMMEQRKIAVNKLDEIFTILPTSNIAN